MRRRRARHLVEFREILSEMLTCPGCGRHFPNANVALCSRCVRAARRRDRLYVPDYWRLTDDYIGLEDEITCADL